MNEEKFIAICKKRLAKAWRLDLDDIDMMNFNFSATFYGFYQAIFVGDKNSRADYIATAVRRVNPFNPLDEKPIEFSIYKRTDFFKSEKEQQND